MEPDQVQFFNGLLSLPWCLAPFLGFLVDNIIQKFGKTTYIIIVTSIIRIFIFSTLAGTQTGISSFHFLQFLITIISVFESILCEYLLLLSTKKANKAIGKCTENHLP